jgi:hypothetical protein
MSKEQEVYALLKENESLKERLKSNRQKIQELLFSDFESEKEKICNIFDLEEKEVGIIKSKKLLVKPNKG